MKKMLRRLFYRFYQFYNIIEGDKDMVFYFSSFAISLLTYFYINLIWAYIYKVTQSSLFKFNPTLETILGFVYVGILVYTFFRNRKSIESAIKLEEKKLIFQDLFILLFVIGGFTSLVLSAVIFKHT